MKVFGPFVI